MYLNSFCLNVSALILITLEAAPPNIPPAVKAIEVPAVKGAKQVPIKASPLAIPTPPAVV